MSALTSLIHVSTLNGLSWVSLFFVAISEIKPFISRVDTIVNALEDSNQDKQYLQALVGLARATSYLYGREEVPDNFVHDIRGRLVELLRAYMYVLFRRCLRN